MAVYDRWHRAAREGDEPCKCSRGKAKLYPSAAHGQGDRWQVRYYNLEGKQRKRNFKLKEGRDPDRHADAYSAKIGRELDTGDYTDPATAETTFRDFAEEWRRNRTHDTTSADKLEQRLRGHAYPVIGDRTLRELSRRPSLTQAWIKGMEAAGLAPRTILQIITDVSGVYNAAAGDGLIAANPTRASSVTRPKPPPKRPRAWPPQRVEAVSAALEGRYQVIPWLGAGTGMRQGEIFGLAVEDITFLGRDPHVHVERQVKHVSGRLRFGPLKNRRPHDVPLAPELAERLARHLELYPAVEVTLPWHDLRDRQRHGKPVTVRLVITDRHGRAVDRDYFDDWSWRPALERAGVIPVRPPGRRTALPARDDGMHALRHTYASLTLGDGVDVMKVARWMGDTPAIVLKTYAHFMPGGEEGGRAAVSAFFGSPGDQNMTSGQAGRA